MIVNEDELKVHIGCGVNYLDNWTNTDIKGKYDLKWNLLEINPFEKKSVNYFFMEHVLEHFTLAEGLKICKSIFNSLKVGGVARISVPSLLSLIDGYLNDPDFINIHNKNFPKNKIKFKSQLFNSVFYHYQHKNIYDEQLLTYVLINAGFKYHKLKFGKPGSGVYFGIERRIYKKNSSVESLIVEATK